MLSNPERADVVQEQIRQAVTTLVAQGHTLTKRAVAEAAGCSPTTVMKYRAIWQASETPDETLPADDPLALTPENLSAWQELEARFAPLSIAARLQGCRYDQVTPKMLTFWQTQYLRLKGIGKQQMDDDVLYKVLRPYKDRLALLEEAVCQCYGKRACNEPVRSVLLFEYPLPRTRTFLGLPFPRGAYSSIAREMQRRQGEVYVDDRY
jgi:hypothetical protein